MALGLEDGIIVYRVRGQGGNLEGVVKKLGCCGCVRRRLLSVGCVLICWRCGDVSNEMLDVWMVFKWRGLLITKGKSQGHAGGRWLYKMVKYILWAKFERSR